MTSRLGDIQIIKDLRVGDGFKHYYYKCINSADTPMTEEEWKKMYSSMNDMDTIIKKFISYCPNLDIFVPEQSTKRGNKARAEKQQKLVKKALKKIKWKSGINEVYDTMESKGDCFFHLYFDNDDENIPRLKYLEPEKMHDIMIDANGEPIAYVYKDMVAKQEIDTLGNVVTLYKRTITYVFEKGKTTIIDPIYDYNEKSKIWVHMQDDSKNPLYSYKEVMNRPSYQDDIAIVRFVSYKKFNEKFSRIPASSYIDHCISLDIENSNVEIINKMLGFPITFITEGSITEGERKPSGFIYVDKKDPNQQNNPTITIGQITNGLESIFKQIRRREDALYDSAGLVNKTAQEKLGNTDSARVIVTYEAPKKNKIELYVDNIIEGMEFYIKVLLKENNLYDEDIDYGVSLFKPKHLSQVSIFDEQLHDQNALNLGSKSKEEIALQNGDSFEDIKNRDIEDVDGQQTTLNAESIQDVRSNNN